MQIDMNQFLNTFFQEADEHLARMESGLLGLEEATVTTELLDDIFRCAHSIKGASGMFGFDDITQFTHVLENLLDRMREGKVAVRRELVDLLLRAVDVLRQLVELAQNGGGAPPEESENVRALLAAENQTGEGQADEPPGPPASDRKTSDDGRNVFGICFAPSPDLFRQGMDPILILRELSHIGRVVEIQTDLSRLPALDDLDPETCYLAWDIRLETDQTAEEIRDVFAFVEDGAKIVVALETESEEGEASAPPAAVAAIPVAAAPVTAVPVAARATRVPGRESSSIRVATDKVDKLIDLVGELVIAQSMASTVLDDFSLSHLTRLQEAFAEVERHTRELQERVMGVRMLPIGTVFSRFPRMVRDLATANDKQIVLQMSGEDTELDKGVVEQMSDPLTHLIRNAVDHGIEPPQHRHDAGKPGEATIRLHAFHEGGSVIVEVSDDGRGLDTERIRRKGIERGLLAEGEELTERQIHALIFEAGFSTSEKVSNLSGRGVGMDVVKRNIQALNGVIELSSEAGRGTCVRIKLPLTLAILDGLLLKVNTETFVLPLISIVESIRPRPEQVRMIAGRGEVVVVRDEPLPLVRLHELFHIPTEVVDPSRGLVAIIEHQGKHLALLVDELLGQQQVVVKSLETHFRKVDGLVGATILGDGRAALILDVSGLAQLAHNADPERTVAA